MQYSVSDMEKRLVRYKDLKPCTNAFIDTRTPGSDQKENFCLIGPGVSEQPGQHIHVKIPHGYNIGGARQPKGCINSQHSHETAEVFLVHSGEWSFNWGHDGTDGAATLKAGDVISIPTNVFRGFENVGADDGFLFAILGEDDPGHVTWAPDVFEKAKGYGMVLLADGTLVDTVAGDVVPEGAELFPPTTMEDVATFRTMTMDEMMDCVLLAEDYVAQPDSVVAKNSSGVTETAIVGDGSDAEGLEAGKMVWPHGFHFRALTLAPGASIPLHARSEQEVIFIQDGNITLSWEDGDIDLSIGDTITVPQDLSHSYKNNSDQEAIVYVVHNGDMPAAPIWQ